MTRTVSARIAGVTFLVYIAAGVGGMVRPPGPLLSVLLSLAMCFSALLLGVTLNAITRDVDRNLALLGLTCRVVEAVLGAMYLPVRLSLRSAAASGADPAALHVLETVFASARSWNIALGAMFFAVASTVFSWLLLRGRLIPSALAWLGVVASLLLVVGLPLQLGGALHGPATMVMWLPMLAFEIPLGVWLIVRGVSDQPAGIRDQPTGIRDQPIQSRSAAR